MAETGDTTTEYDNSHKSQIAENLRFGVGTLVYGAANLTP
jgi:hypothetical protein